MDKEHQEVRVELGERSYNIHIGYGLMESCVASLTQFAPEKDVFIISDANVYGLYGARLENALTGQGYRPAASIIPAGEASKTWAQAEAILTRMLELNLGRKTAVLALGGGVVGDLAGFVAALYRRGVLFFQVPTTLLAQVDSSVGGKVAVNHSLGKNMLGTFYQPRAVWAELDMIGSLPQEEWAAGLAEVCKYAVIWDHEFFLWLEKEAQRIKERDPEVVVRMIARCCEIKAEIVGRDERDEGLRNLLNFGHTFGHALEAATAYKKYRHGEAVAVGMAGALKLAVSFGMLEAAVAVRVENLLRFWDLPLSFPAELIASVLACLKQDKKVTDHQVLFVLPTALGAAELKSGFPEKLLKDTLAGLAAGE